MDTQNRSAFEKEWEDAFEGAEIEPSKATWDRVALALANSANGSFRKKIIVFKLMAAASVAFALAVGSISLYKGYFDDSAQPIARNEVPGEPGTPQSDLIAENNGINDPEGSLKKTEEGTLAYNDNDIRVPDEGTVFNRSAANSDAENGSKDKADHQMTFKARTARETGVLANGNLPDNRVASNGNYIDSDRGSIAYGISKDDQPSFSTDNAIPSGLMSEAKGMDSDLSMNRTAQDIPERLEKLMTELETASIRERELAMVPWYVYNDMQSKKSHTKKVWAGFGMGAGEFDLSQSASVAEPSFANQGLLDFHETSRQYFLSSSSADPDISEEGSGTSINIGINFGVEVAPRWVVQSGVSFIRRSTMNTSNVALVNDAGSSNARSTVLNDANTLPEVEDFSQVEEYEVDNLYRLISVPLQVGYVVLDKKLAITLLGGVSNDVLLRRSASTESGDLEDNSGRNGFRKYNVAGLVSTEVGYKLGKHYQVSLIPQIRQSINSIRTTSDDEKPTFVEMAFRFKYIIQ